MNKLNRPTSKVPFSHLHPSPPLPLSPVHTPLIPSSEVGRSTYLLVPAPPTTSGNSLPSVSAVYLKPLLLHGPLPSTSAALSPSQEKTPSLTCLILQLPPLCPLLFTQRFRRVDLLPLFPLIPQSPRVQCLVPSAPW